MIYLILATIMYTLVILFGAAAARHTNAVLSAAVANLVSALAPLVILIPLVSRKFVVNQKLGIFLSVLTGVSIGIFTILLTKSYAVNKVGIVAPIVFGGAIFLSTALSYFIFKEKVSTLQFIGLLFLAAGFGLVIYARASGK